MLYCSRKRGTFNRPSQRSRPRRHSTSNAQHRIDRAAVRSGKWNRVERFHGKPALRALVNLVPRFREDIKSDAVICERKDRRVNWAVGSRSSFERRQNPHAAPAPGGAFEKNFVLPDNIDMIFGEPSRPWMSFLHRKDSGIYCATKSFHRTNLAFRFARQTDERAKIDKRGVEMSGMALR